MSNILVSVPSYAVVRRGETSDKEILGDIYDCMQS